ncbi:hypothetical protein C8Q78DRAFT_337103 [Trametes maxima]|nr:hypothetical protein C8Q78DRAFT_337103 [Trametes maxima]
MVTWLNKGVDTTWRGLKLADDIGNGCMAYWVGRTDGWAGQTSRHLPDPGTYKSRVLSPVCAEAPRRRLAETGGRCHDKTRKVESHALRHRAHLDVAARRTRATGEHARRASNLEHRTGIQILRAPFPPRPLSDYRPFRRDSVTQPEGASRREETS